MKIAVTFGVRPEIIKLAEVAKVLRKRNHDVLNVYSGQHYDTEMRDRILDDMDLWVDRDVQVGSGSHGHITGEMMKRLEAVYTAYDPDVVITQGDTNTTLAACIAASKMDTAVAHVEAGLRSHNREMPEETNRIVADAVADYCFAPTELQETVLLEEGKSDNQVFVTGNTVVDAVTHVLGEGYASGVADDYILVTLHRPSNVDNDEAFTAILNELDALQRSTGKQIKVVVHPRSADRFQKHADDHMHLLEPQPYPDFLTLLQNASCVITDSGGVQEESMLLGVPCVVAREETERREVVEDGHAVISGTDVVDGYQTAMEREAEPVNPYGEDPAKRVVDAIEQRRAGK